MTDLQLGLLAIGAVAVVGVFAFNQLQERRARRDAERAFSSRHADVLLQEGSPSREAASLSGKVLAQPPGAMPDERVDYVVVLRSAVGVPSGAVLEAWRAIEARFGQRALLAGSGGSGWRRLAAGDLGSSTALHASLQLVSRAGVVSDAELIEFRTETETLATRLGASVSAPEMRPALDAARELDRMCADADVQVALHVVGTNAEAPDLSGMPYQVSPREGGGITFTLDVARTVDPVKAFEAMARAARQLAGEAGKVVDDNGNALDDRALASIGAQLEAVRARLAERGIEPGSPLALRLFS